jgi:hypothetical protein
MPVINFSSHSLGCVSVACNALVRCALSESHRKRRANRRALTRLLIVISVAMPLWGHLSLSLVRSRVDQLSPAEGDPRNMPCAMRSKEEVV